MPGIQHVAHKFFQAEGQRLAAIFKSTKDDPQGKILRRLMLAMREGDMLVYGQKPDAGIPLAWYLTHPTRIVFDLTALGESAYLFTDYLLPPKKRQTLDSTVLPKFAPAFESVQFDSAGKTLVRMAEQRATWFDKLFRTKRGYRVNLPSDMQLDMTQSRDNQCLMVGVEGAGIPLSDPAYAEEFHRRFLYNPAVIDTNTVSVRITPAQLRRLLQRQAGALLEDCWEPPLNAETLSVTTRADRQTAFEHYAKAVTRVTPSATLYPLTERKILGKAPVSAAVVQKQMMALCEASGAPFVSLDQEKSYAAVGNAELFFYSNRVELSGLGTQKDTDTRKAIELAADALIAKALGEGVHRPPFSKPIFFKMTGSPAMQALIKEIAAEKGLTEYVSSVSPVLPAPVPSAHVSSGDKTVSQITTTSVSSRQILEMADVTRIRAALRQPQATGIDSQEEAIQMAVRHARGKSVSADHSQMIFNGFGAYTAPETTEAFLTRGKNFLRAADLWMTTLYAQDQQAAQRDKTLYQLHQLYLTMERSILDCTNNIEKRALLDRFLGQITHQLAVVFQKNQIEVHKDLLVAENFYVWEKGRLPLCTQMTLDDTTYLQIERPITQLTNTQHEELGKIYTAREPAWFSLLSPFAQIYLKKQLASDPANPTEIASPEVVNQRYLTMPSSLKSLPGTSNFSEHTLVILDKEGIEKDRLSYLRSASITPNGIKNLTERARIATQNLEQVLWRDTIDNVDDVSNITEDFKNFWEFAPEKAPSAIPVLAATVLSPGVHEKAPFNVMRFRADNNLQLVEHKNNAIRVLKETDHLKENKINLFGANHIINSLRGGILKLFALRKDENLRNRENTLHYTRALQDVLEGAVLPKIGEGEKIETYFLKIVFENLSKVLKEISVVPEEGFWLSKADHELFSARIKEALQLEAQFGLLFKIPQPGKPQRGKDLAFVLKALKDYVELTNFRQDRKYNRNSDLFGASLGILLTSKLQGIAHCTCKSGKDRTGVEVLHTDAMMIYYDRYGELPNYFDESTKREKFVEILKELFISQHQQYFSAQNAPGSYGLKSLGGMLPKDLEAAILNDARGKKLFMDNKPLADMNVPHNRALQEKIARQLRAENVLLLTTLDSFDALHRQIIDPVLADVVLKMHLSAPEKLHLSQSMVDDLNKISLHYQDFSKKEVTHRLTAVGLNETAVTQVITSMERYADPAQTQDKNEDMRYRQWLYEQQPGRSVTLNTFLQSSLGLPEQPSNRPQLVFGA